MRMIPSKKPENFDELVERIAAGELTRKQAADLCGLNYHTFKGWITRSGAASKLRDSRGNVGENNLHSHAKTNPELAQAYKDAVSVVLANQKVSMLSIWRKDFQHLRYELLRQKVLAAKQTAPDKETARILEKALRMQEQKKHEQQGANP